MKIQCVDGFKVPLRQEVKGKAATEKTVLNLSEVRDPADQAEEERIKELDRQKLEEAVEKTNKTMEMYNTELRFSIHEESGEVMVRVINTKDNSVIREIPPERILNFVAYVKKMLGIIIDKLI
ncbi:Uncharacterized flagellar protein FlaG [Pelotomaculum thermopropionicum SI]|uniref:Uncharacterized flagellar protein FlaG n=1 Tax=Pelotomaculum thermopropionicum (strain DSM 13744 / JCM 10971 / SI) TaxID=370438 RepID=A5D0G1_PELTS|nr:Uncharacterized flagellar protein FlaG [Pelotomaculum thermopropionicum SI]